ncbi:heterokaryon incompatibility protein-domain-containing protein, partial [Hyaloscypha finlandica]
MRLLNTETLQLQQFDQEPFPPYAILSHRWGDQEIPFQELEAGLGKDRDGYQKITTFCAQARDRGFEWAWVDTCGIDKTSSAELSEAINSMYKWYEQSAVCFVYLSDVTAQVQPDGSTYSPDFDNSCWFTRGWTLQELIAPHSVEFYSSDWTHIGDKSSRVDELSRITGVDAGVLHGANPVRACSVARIMSWASKRVTTRKEDIAYCLLGLFGIHMPLLYGEGDRAFIRLQEETLKQSSDQSLFAWNPLVEKPYWDYPDDFRCGIFAPSPACFADSRDIVPLREFWDTESALTNRGVRLRMPFKYTGSMFLGFLCCE